MAKQRKSTSKATDHQADTDGVTRIGPPAPDPEETMNKIPILIWEGKNWAEIPQQDNPAFNKKGRRNKSILVMKVLPYEATAVGENGFGVIEVPLEGDVFRKGLFWELEDAKLFAEALSTRTTQPQKEDKQCNKQNVEAARADALKKFNADLAARIGSFAADVVAQRAEAVAAPAEEPPPILPQD